VPSNRAPLLLADLFLHTSDRKNGTLGAKKLAQRKQGGKRGKEPASGSEICSGFTTFPSNLCPGEPLAMSLLFISAAACDVLASPWSASHYFGFKNRGV